MQVADIQHAIFITPPRGKIRIRMKILTEIAGYSKDRPKTIATFTLNKKRLSKFKTLWQGFVRFPV